VDVKLVKLVSGEEFIAEDCSDSTISSQEFNKVKISSEDKTRYNYFKNPITLQPTKDGLHMIPYPIFRKDPELIIKECHVLFKIDIPSEISNEYKRQFGGIIEPSKSLVL